jgi:hypothetical protein
LIVIVQVHSVGSLWQESRRRAVFNSTAIEIAGVQRSRAKVFGQVRFSPAELHQALATGPLQGSNWNATSLREYRGIRKLHLTKRAGRRHPPELFLVAVSDETCGRLDAHSWSNELAQLVSWSESGGRQELMFLMKPFAYLRGVTGAAVLTPRNGSAHWTVTRW